jgi:hypothetical protein
LLLAPKLIGHGIHLRALRSRALALKSRHGYNLNHT